MSFCVDRIAGNTPANNTPDQDVMWGKDDWIGRQIRKDFGEPHGIFIGNITAVDDWAGHPGQRLFKVVYTDGDSEWMDARKVKSMLLNVAQVVSACIIFKYYCCVFLIFIFCIPLMGQEEANSAEAAALQPQAQQQTQQPTQKKKGKYADYETAPADPVLFLFDVEVTGPKRNFDRIIAISFLAYDVDGNLMGAFSRHINPDGVRINEYANKIHGELCLHKFVQLFVSCNCHHLTSCNCMLVGLSNAMLVG